MLVGREAERATTRNAIDAARAGRGGALVLRGEAGIGKTALLDDVVAHADAMTVVRTVGVESETELEFSALLDVCRPLLEHLTELPRQQADALGAVLGLGPRSPSTGSLPALRRARSSQPPRRSNRCSWSSTTRSGSIQSPPTHCCSRRGAWRPIACSSSSPFGRERSGRSSRRGSRRCGSR